MIANEESRFKQEALYIQESCPLFSFIFMALCTCMLACAYELTFAFVVGFCPKLSRRESKSWPLLARKYMNSYSGRAISTSFNLRMKGMYAQRARTIIWTEIPMRSSNPPANACVDLHVGRESKWRCLLLNLRWRRTTGCGLCSGYLSTTTCHVRHKYAQAANQAQILQKREWNNALTLCTPCKASLRGT